LQAFVATWWVLLADQATVEEKRLVGELNVGKVALIG